jgi:hypothetical protein
LQNKLHNPILDKLCNILSALYNFTFRRIAISECSFFVSSSFRLAIFSLGGAIRLATQHTCSARWRRRRVRVYFISLVYRERNKLPTIWYKAQESMRLVGVCIFPPNDTFQASEMWKINESFFLRSALGFQYVLFRPNGLAIQQRGPTPAYAREKRKKGEKLLCRTTLTLSNVRCPFCSRAWARSSPSWTQRS